MQAAVLRGKQDMAVMGRNQQDLMPDEVRIRVKACGICGTDQHIYHGHPGSAEVKPPIVLGHELSGEVVATESSVSDLKVGDRVSVDPNIYCGRCDYCRNGSPHLCDHLQAIGVTRDGGMGEYCNIPAANCYLLPEPLTYVEGALIEPLGCVLHGFKKLNVRPVHTVLIIGGGFIGRLFLQLVRLESPARIFISEPAVEKHEELILLGADRVIRSDDAAEVEAMYNQADIVIECVGRKESMQFAVRAAKKGGQVLLFGVASPDMEIPVSPFSVFTKELKIMGSFINPNTHQEAIALVRKQAVKVEPLVSHRFSLHEIPHVMAEYPKMGVTKGVIVYDSPE